MRSSITRRQEKKVEEAPKLLSRKQRSSLVPKKEKPLDVPVFNISKTERKHSMTLAKSISKSSQRFTEEQTEEVKKNLAAEKEYYELKAKIYGSRK